MIIETIKGQFDLPLDEALSRIADGTIWQAQMYPEKEDDVLLFLASDHFYIMTKIFEDGWFWYSKDFPLSGFDPNEVKEAIAQARKAGEDYQNRPVKEYELCFQISGSCYIKVNAKDESEAFEKAIYKLPEDTNLEFNHVWTEEVKK